MKRRKFIQQAALTTSAVATGNLAFSAGDKVAKKELHDCVNMKFILEADKIH